jgi:hypothetical protein
MELVEIMFRLFLWMNTGSIENICQIQANGGGHLHQAAQLVMMMTPLFGLFLRPVSSATMTAATVTGCAQFVSFPLQSLNLVRKMMINGRE